MHCLVHLQEKRLIATAKDKKKKVVLESNIAAILILDVKQRLIAGNFHKYVVDLLKFIRYYFVTSRIKACSLTILGHCIRK